jgi:hypothetical protein
MNGNNIMDIIYSTQDFTIHQDKKKQTIYSISNTMNTMNTMQTRSLYNSIINTKLIQHATIITNDATDAPDVPDVPDVPDTTYTNKTKTITKTLYFKAFTVESFKKFKEKYIKKNKTNKFSYTLVLDIICSLSKQIRYLLENESKCFYRIDTSNIVVIDGNKFIYLSHEDLKDVKEKQIHIYRPIPKSEGYLSPELKKANIIPILVNYKTIFYSLGLFILDNIRTNEDINEEETNEDIKDTKLYFFIKRCLCTEPEKRFLLYV